MTITLHAVREQQETKPQHVVERIAGAIVNRLRHHGQCSIMDIKAMGFSLNDIARYWPEACRIAERENSKWRILNG